MTNLLQDEISSNLKASSRFASSTYCKSTLPVADSCDTLISLRLSPFATFLHELTRLADIRWIPIVLLGFPALDPIRAESPGELQWSTTVPIDARHQELRITNPSRESISFQFKLNGTFPLTVDEMIADIEARALENNQPKVRSAWQYVFDHTFHSVPYSDQPWIHDPFLFINSVATGFCDDRSTVLAEIWGRMGYSSRILSLGGHVIPEVSSQGRWQYFDPDRGVFYTDRAHRVVGAGRFEQSGCEGLETVGTNPMQQRLWQCGTPMMEQQARVFTSRENNRERTAWFTDYEPLERIEFVLPAQSSMVISSNIQEGHSVLAVELRESSKGIVRIPLVPYALEGRMKIAIGGRVIESEENMALELNREVGIEPLSVEKVAGEARIYYLTNPRLASLLPVNQIEISRATGKLEIRVAQKRPAPRIAARFEALRFDTLKKHHSIVLEQLPQDFGAVTASTLREQYRSYLESDSTLEPGEREALSKSFEKGYKRVASILEVSEKGLLQITAERYPESMFTLFLVLRYEAWDYLQSQTPESRLSGAPESASSRMLD